MSADLLQSYERWEHSGRHDALLLPPGPLLAAAEQLLAQSPEHLSSETAAYIQASLDHDAQRQAHARWLRGIALTAALTAAVFSAVVSLAVWWYLTARTTPADLKPPNGGEVTTSAKSSVAPHDAAATDQAAAASATSVEVAELVAQVDAYADEAARRTYLLAEARWRERRVGEAYELLETIPPARRRLEWHLAHRQMEGSDVTLYAEGVIKSRAAFTVDGARLFAVVGGALKSWDVATGASFPESDADLGSVTRFALSDDATRLAFLDRGGTLCVWDVTTDVRLHAWPAPSNKPTTIVFSPDGQMLAWVDDQGVTLRDASTGESRLTLPGDVGVVEGVAYSPDGSRLGAVCRDGARQLWDVRSGELLSLTAQTGAAGDVAFSPDGRWMAAPAARDGIDQLDLQHGGAIAHTLNPRPHRPAREAVQTATFSPDGTIVAMADGSVIYLWDAASGRLLRELAGHTSTVTRLSFSNDGSRLASGSDDGTIKLWNLRSPGVATTLRHADGTGGRLGFRSNDATLVAVSDRGGVQSFTPLGGQSLQHPANAARNPELGLAVSSNALRWASQEENGSLTIIDVATGSPRTIAAAGLSPRLSLEFNRDGSQLAARGGDLRLWDAATGQVLKVITAPDDLFTCVAASDDGQRVAGGLVSGVVKVWDAADGSLISTFQTSRDHYWIPRQVKFSRDGARLAAVYDDGAIVVWHGRQTRAEAVVLRGRTALCCDFSPDGALLVSGDKDGGGALWNARTGEQLWEFPSMGRPTTDVVFDQEGVRLAHFHADGEIRLWDLSPRHEFKVALLAAPATSESVRSAARAPRVVDPQYAGLPEVVAFRRRQAEIDATWHERQASAAESAQPPNWYAAAFHLAWAADSRPADPALAERLGVAFDRWRSVVADRRQAGPALTPNSDDPRRFFAEAVRRRLPAAKSD